MPAPVVCFTMLHHVPSVRQQDDLLREARRVLRPGGVFAGLDSLPRWKVRLIHLFDTMVPVDPATFPARNSPESIALLTSRTYSNTAASASSVTQAARGSLSVISITRF